MIVLLGFAFLGGIVTILSPCILPVLPILLSGSATGGKRRPVGVVLGFVGSFTIFTLFLSSVVSATNISPETLRLVAVIALGLFGVTLVVPNMLAIWERIFSGLSSRVPRTSSRSGFWGGVAIGISLGLLWTPCVGPILASVISLALAGEVTGAAALITFSYALGTGIPMLAVMYGGRTLLARVPWLQRHSSHIQRVFGVLMLLTAVAILFNVDRKFQTYFLDHFPSYGRGLTNIEDTDAVRTQLEHITNTSDVRK